MHALLMQIVYMFSVHVSVVPGRPPQNVTVTVLSSTEFELNWIEIPEIDQNGIITQYEVMYTQLMTFNTSTIFTTDLSITVSDLEEFAEYSLLVRAYTSVGPGPFSVGVIATLKAGKPIITS